MNSDFRVGITTYFDSFNEGTVLQAYCVQSLLQKSLPEARIEFVNYRFRKRPIPKYLLNIRKSKRNYLRFIREQYFKQFVKENLNVSGPQLVTKSCDEVIGFVAGKYDLMVTGSDTIWQVLDHPAVPPFPNIYWLPKRLECKKIALSASANRTRLEGLTDMDKKMMSDSLQQYSIIGVRDDLTHDLVSELLNGSGRNVRRMPDPTFMMEIPETDVKKKLEKAGINTQKPLLGFNLPDNELTRKILSYYHKRGFQLLQLGGFSDLVLIDSVVGVPLKPFEWAQVYKYLSLCITDRFHGTVFSLKNKCPVLTLDFDARYMGLSSKTFSILNEFGQSERHVCVFDKKTTFDSIIETAKACENDYEHSKIESKLQANKQILTDYANELRSLATIH